MKAIDIERFKKCVDYILQKGICTKQEQIAVKMGVNPVYLSHVLNGIRPLSYKFVNTFLDAFPQINPDFLQSSGPFMSNDLKKELDQAPGITTPNTVPVVPIVYVCDYILNEGNINLEVQKFTVPIIQQMGADFLVPISGYELPSFNYGRYVAVKIAPKNVFYQWGRVYLLCTSQGVLFKRVMKGQTENEIICSSDEEKKFPSFALPVDDIKALGLVVGVLKIE
jgi:hypothetical protein